jgi:hypothetical protein
MAASLLRASGPKPAMLRAFAVRCGVFDEAPRRSRW